MHRGNLLLLLALSASCAGCAARPAPVTRAPVPALALTPGYPLEMSLAPAPALYHWVDCLARTSPAKTVAGHRQQYRRLFGKMTAADEAVLERFLSWRRRTLPLLRPQIRDGVEIAPASVALAEFAAAEEVGAALERLAAVLPEHEVEELRIVLEYFAPRYAAVWDGGRVVRGFADAALRDPLRGSLAAFLVRMAGFYGVDPAALPPPRLVLVPVPDGYGTHAQALGRHLLLEIRENDSLAEQAEVIVHENAHLHWYAVGATRREALALAAREAGARGETALVLLREALPTALGQGVAGRELNGLRWSLGLPWYHLTDVDRYAKALAPLVEAVLRANGRLDEDFMRRAVDALPEDLS